MDLARQAFVRHEDGPSPTKRRTKVCLGRHGLHVPLESKTSASKKSHRSRSMIYEIQEHDIGKEVDDQQRNVEGRRAHLTQVHDDGLVDLLPQVSAEDLDEGDLERRDLAVHEDARQVQLHLHNTNRKSSCYWHCFPLVDLVVLADIIAVLPLCYRHDNQTAVDNVPSAPPDQARTHAKGTTRSANRHSSNCHPLTYECVTTGIAPLTNTNTNKIDVFPLSDGKSPKQNHTKAPQTQVSIVVHLRRAGPMSDTKTLHQAMGEKRKTRAYLASSPPRAGEQKRPRRKKTEGGREGARE